MKSPNTLTADEITKLIEKAGDELKNKPASFYTEIIDWVVEKNEKNWIDAYLHNYNKDKNKNRASAEVEVDNFISNNVDDALITYPIGEDRYLGDELDETQFNYADSLADTISEIAIEKYNLHDYFGKKYDEMIDEFEKSVAPTKLREEEEVFIPPISTIKLNYIFRIVKDYFISKCPDNISDYINFNIGGYDRYTSNNVISLYVGFLGAFNKGTYSFTIYYLPIKIGINKEGNLTIDVPANTTGDHITPQNHLPLNHLPLGIRDGLYKFMDDVSVSELVDSVNKSLLSFSPVKLKENLDHTLPLKEDITLINLYSNRIMLHELLDRIEKYFTSKEPASLKGVEMEWSWVSVPDSKSAIDAWVNVCGVGDYSLPQEITLLSCRLWFISNDGDWVLDEVEEEAKDRNGLRGLFSYLTEKQRDGVKEFIKSISPIGLKNYVNKWLEGTHLTKLKENIDHTLPSLKEDKSILFQHSVIKAISNEVSKRIEAVINANHTYRELVVGCFMTNSHISYNDTTITFITHIFGIGNFIEIECHSKDGNYIDSCECEDLTETSYINSSTIDECINMDWKSIINGVIKSASPVSLKESYNKYSIISNTLFQSLLDSIFKYLEDRIPTSLNQYDYDKEALDITWSLDTDLPLSNTYTINLFINFSPIRREDGTQIYSCSFTVEKDENGVDKIVSNSEFKQLDIPPKISSSASKEIGNYISSINLKELVDTVNKDMSGFDPVKLKESLPPDKISYIKIEHIFEEIDNYFKNKASHPLIKDGIHVGHWFIIPTEVDMFVNWRGYWDGEVYDIRLYEFSLSISEDENGNIIIKLDKNKGLGVVSNRYKGDNDNLPPYIKNLLDDFTNSINIEDFMMEINKLLVGFSLTKLKEDIFGKDSASQDSRFVHLLGIMSDYFDSKIPSHLKKENGIDGSGYLNINAYISDNNPKDKSLILNILGRFHLGIAWTNVFAFILKIYKDEEGIYRVSEEDSSLNKLRPFADLDNALGDETKEELNTLSNSLSVKELIDYTNKQMDDMRLFKLKEDLPDSESIWSNIVDAIGEYIYDKVEEVDGGFLKDKLYLDSTYHGGYDRGWVYGVEVIVYSKVPQTDQAYGFVSLYIQLVGDKVKINKTSLIIKFDRYVKMGLNNVESESHTPTEETKRIIKDVIEFDDIIDGKEVEKKLDINLSPTPLKEAKDEMDYSNDNMVREFYTKSIDKWLDYYKNHIVKYVAVHKDEWGKIKDSEFVSALIDEFDYDLFQHLFYEVSSKLDLPPTRRDVVMERIEDIVNDAYSLYDLDKYIETSLINRVKDIIRDFTPTKLKEALDLDNEYHGMFSFKDGVLTIEDRYIFSFLDNVISQMIKNSIRTIKGEMEGVKKLVISPQIKTIMHDALSFWMDLEEVEFMPGSKLEVIQNDAFEGCVKLNKINLNSLTHLHHIGDSAFWDCTSLTRIDIPEGVTFIGPSVFGDCSRLEEINLPSTLTNLSTRILGDASHVDEISHIKHIYLNSSKGKVDIRDKFLEYAYTHNFLSDMVNPHIFVSVKLKEEKLDEAPDAWGIETPTEISREVENKIKQSNFAKIKVITKIKDLLTQLQNEGKLEKPEFHNWGGMASYSFNSNITAKELNDIFASHKDILPEVNGPHPFSIRDYNTTEWRYSLPVIIEDIRQLNRTPTATGMTVSEFTGGDRKGDAFLVLLLPAYALELMERQPVKLK